MNTKLIKATSLLLFFTFGIVIIGCETQEQREKKREEKRTQKFVLQLNNRNQDIKTRVNAARALGRINTPTTQKELVSAIPMLIEALDNTDTSTRAFAASALGNIGKSAKKAIPNLTNNLRNDGSDLVRGSAAYALGQMKESAQSAIPDLVKALDDENELVRQSAAKALGQINLPQATEALKRHKSNTPN